MINLVSQVSWSHSIMVSDDIIAPSSKREPNHTGYFLTNFQFFGCVIYNILLILVLQIYADDDIFRRLGGFETYL